ncbi:MAG TPA: hypothetical protein DCW31_11235 [Lactobacillus sp.]|nr:hypothetical protein [Lactobacillus sp.]
MKHQISLKDMGTFIVKKGLIILAFGIVFGIAGHLYAQRQVTTTYTAHRSLIISHAKLKDDAYTQTQADIALINTYSNVVTDPVVTDKINSQMKHVHGYKYSAKSLPDKLNVATQPDAAWMKISAQSSNKRVAEKLADTAARTAKKELPKYISPAGRIILLAPSKDNSVSSDTAPSTKKLTVFAGVVGLFVGAFVVYSWQLFKNVRTKHRTTE